MNRRSFLQTGGALATVGSFGLRPKMMYGQSTVPDPTTYNALVAAHSIAVGNFFYHRATVSDWQTVENAARACLSEWSNNGRDAGVRSAAFSISASQVRTSSLDTTTILSTVTKYQSQMTLANVYQGIAFVDNNPALVPTVITKLQQSGMSYYLNVLIQEAGLIAQGLGNGTIIDASSLRGGLPISFAKPPANLPPPGTNPGQDGGGGYNCSTDGAAIWAAGIAFATIGVMTMGVAPVLAGAAWAGIAVWGGLGVTGWGVGHAVAGCSF